MKELFGRSLNSLNPLWNALEDWLSLLHKGNLKHCLIQIYQKNIIFFTGIKVIKLTDFQSFFSYPTSNV